MARVDAGDFGHIEPEAVIDTIGVRLGWTTDIGRALVSQLLANLQALRVDRVRTLVEWDDRVMLGFLNGAGFAPAAPRPATRHPGLMADLPALRHQTSIVALTSSAPRCVSIAHPEFIGRTFSSGVPATRTATTGHLRS